MIDYWVVSGSFAAVLMLLAGQRRLKLSQDAGKVMDRLGAAASSRPTRAAHSPVLGGLAARVAGTTVGAKLAVRAASNHPGTPFSDFLAVGIASLIGGGLAGALFFGSLVPTVGLCVGMPVLVERFFMRLHGSRSARMEKQLPAALTLQASALRAGQSLVRSLRIVVEAGKAPLKEELDRMLDQVNLGLPLEEALDQFSARTGSADIDLWVNSMLIHRQTGGNLANVIDSMSGRVTQRINLRGEIKALTAQGRLSGLVVAASPIAFFLMLSIGSRDQMAILYTTPIGWVLLITGLTLNGLGLLWIRVVLRIRP